MKKWKRFQILPQLSANAPILCRIAFIALLLISIDSFLLPAESNAAEPTEAEKSYLKSLAGSEERIKRRFLFLDITSINNKDWAPGETRNYDYLKDTKPTERAVFFADYYFWKYHGLGPFGLPNGRTNISRVFPRTPAKIEKMSPQESLSWVSDWWQSHSVKIKQLKLKSPAEVARWIKDSTVDAEILLYRDRAYGAAGVTHKWEMEESRQIVHKHLLDPTGLIKRIRAEQSRGVAY